MSKLSTQKNQQPTSVIERRRFKMQREHNSFTIEDLCDFRLDDEVHNAQMAEAMLNDDLRSSPIPDLQLEVKKPKRNSKEMSDTKEDVSEKAAQPVNDNRKVVQIMVPPKRPKLSQNVTAKQVIDGTLRRTVCIALFWGSESQEVLPSSILCRSQ